MGKLTPDEIDRRIAAERIRLERQMASEQRYPKMLAEMLRGVADLVESGAINEFSCTTDFEMEEVRPDESGKLDEWKKMRPTGARVVTVVMRDNPINPWMAALSRRVFGDRG